MKKNHCSNNNKINQTKYKLKIHLCIFIFLCLIWLISFFRVPVVGVLLDAIFFEFLFGYTKYLIYLILLITLIFWFKKPKFYFIFSKRHLIFYILLILFFCFLLSTINLYINHLQNLNFSEFYINHNEAYLNNWYIYNLKNILNIKNYLYFNKFAWGGLIGTLFISILNKYSFIVFLIFILLGLILVFLLVFNNKISKKIKEKAINKLGGFNSNQIKITEQSYTIESQEILEKNKLLILDNTNLKENQIEFKSDLIIINVINLSELKTIIELTQKLKISNVKIMIDTNNIKTE